MDQPGRFNGSYELREVTVSQPTRGLHSEWIRVESLPVHARVSVDPAPAGALPVVLVHGIGVASRFMVPVAKLLAPYHPVYAPDLPGFGKSGKPNRILSLVELTDAMAWWTREIGLESAAFLGNSFGCQIVVDLALRYPELVERAVLQGPTMDPRARTAWRQIARWLRNSRREPFSHGLISAREYPRCGLRRLTKTFQYEVVAPQSNSASKPCSSASFCTAWSTSFAESSDT
jgi:2-hydroxy-6-oxonona-2,4-dienedioate hydrolase